MRNIDLEEMRLAAILSHMKTLKQIIGHLGPSEVSRRVGMSPAYVSQMGKGDRAVSASVLARALAVWGAELDLAGTLREMRAEDFEAVRRMRTDETAAAVLGQDLGADQLRQLERRIAERRAELESDGTEQAEAA